jgi:aminoglycoside phosphotransferase
MNLTKADHIRLIYFLEAYKDLVEEDSYNEDDFPEEEEIRAINNLIKKLKNN